MAGLFRFHNSQRLCPYLIRRTITLPSASTPFKVS